MPSRFTNRLPLLLQHFFTFFLIALGVLVFSNLALAGTTGKVAGRLTDADNGEGLPGANVVLEGTTFGAATDVNGNYVILNVPPGVYSITFSFVGYQSVRVKEVRVSVDFTTTLNQKLKASAVEVGTVEVIGERQPLVRQDLTNTTVAVNSETIDNLPVDAVQDVIRLQSGVTVDNSGGIHIRGGRSNEIAYLINGISVANAFNNSQAVGIATNAIEELSVSSGTFSAEYGDALSGVINFVTKDGGPNYKGNLKFWTGDNVSSHKDLFENIDDHNPLNNSRTEATFSGPVPFTNDKLTFFSSGVYVDNKGYLYGKRLYLPTDGLIIDGSRYLIDPYGDGVPSGDNQYVPMNKFISTNATAKLSYRATNKIKLTYDLLFDRGRSQSFSRTYKYNPDGRPTFRSTGQSHSLGLTQALGNKFFYTLKGAYSESIDRGYVYEDPRDSRYVPSDLATTIPNTGFLAGGTDLSHDRLDARTYNVKLDAVSQLLKNHEVKLGAEARVHRLELESYTLIYDTTMAKNGQAPIVPYRSVNSEYTGYTYYLRRPKQFAAYILDKMELARTLILNAGVRLEYLDTNARYNTDLVTNVDNPDAEENLQRSSSKIRLSPRISFSYPITDRGIIRFSYGHFYQMPTLSSLYRNPYFESFNYIVTPTYGDPNLEPERSIQYEMGLQQQLGDDFKFELAIYYKDVNNLLQTRQVLAGTVGDRVFNILTNVAYANVRGFTFSLLKRRAIGSPFSASLDYTYQIAEGNLSDPTANFFDAKSGKETEQTFVFLDHDRTHTLNGTFSLGKPNNWNVSALTSLWMGSPYTPVLPASLSPVTFSENSARRPTFLNVDFRAEKFFKLSKFDFSVFTQIENVFDIKNENFVFSSSGSALSAIEEKTEASTLNSVRRQFARNPSLFPPVAELDNFYRRAEWLSEPREVRVGFSVLY